MKNTFGQLLQIHTFGESHGPALGVVIDGMPAGVPFRGDILITDLARRRPGQWGQTTNTATSLRQEPDQPEILSGIYHGLTLGTPIAVIVRNTDARSEDYENLPLRQGHADDLWLQKFGHADLRGGGRASGRETLSRVIAGSFAKMLLSQKAPQMMIKAFAAKVHTYELTAEEQHHAMDKTIDHYVARFPSETCQNDVTKLLKLAQINGESYSGKARVVIKNPPRYLGQPVFHKLKNDLASAALSIGASSGISFSDSTEPSAGTLFHTPEQHYHGIRGGISSGDDIIFDIDFKPTSSILDVAKKGRHDPFIVTRAIPVIEAMTTLVMADHILWAQLDSL